MKKYITVVLSIIVVAGGLFAFQFTTHKSLASMIGVGSSTSKTLTPTQLKDQTVDSAEIITNLKDYGHFGRVQFSFVTDNKNTVQEVTTRQFQLQNFVIKDLADVTSTDLETNNGSDELTKNIKNYLNGVLSNGKVTSVYLKEKLIQ